MSSRIKKKGPASPIELNTTSDAVTQEHVREERALSGELPAVAAQAYLPQARPFDQTKVDPQLRVAEQSEAPKITADYGEWAKKYDADTASYGWCAPQKLLAATFRHVQPESAQRVLDVGVGTGKASEPFLDAGAQVVGLDKEEPMLVEARKAFPRFHQLSTYDINDPVGTAGVQPGTFDLVLSSGVLHFSKDLRFTLSTLSTALRPGGTLSFTYVPVQDRRFGTATHLHLPSKVARMLKDLGMELLEHEQFVAYYDKGNQQDPVRYMLVVARKKGEVQAMPEALSGLDRTACVDRQQVLAAYRTPLLQGPLVTAPIAANTHPEYRQLLEDAQRQVERGELDPAKLTLPTSTPRSAMKGAPGCDALLMLAHPDDETVYGGGTVRALLEANTNAALVLATGGEGGRNLNAARSDLETLRAEEVSQAAASLGAAVARLYPASKEITLGAEAAPFVQGSAAPQTFSTLPVAQLGFADFGKYTDQQRSQPATALDTLRRWGLVPLVEALVEQIRLHRPRVLLGFEPVRDPNYSLHGHHLAMGYATTLAFHLAADAESFPEQIARGLKPWAPSYQQAIVPTHADAGRSVDIQVNAAAKAAALKAYQSQRFSTERLIASLESGSAATSKERWHLVQSRLGRPSGEGVYALFGLTNIAAASGLYGEGST